MANAEFWNERYDDDAYIYGTAPNAFLAEAAEAHFPAPPATVYDLGAGEGRTAVFLATRGYDVTAVDASGVGLRKAHALAARHSVRIDAQEADLTTWAPEEEKDAVVCSFLHFAPADRPRLYRMMQAAVRPGGIVAAEWFRPEQRTQNRPSGGPPSVDLMITADELREHFPEDGIVYLEDAQPVLSEGEHHKGPAETVRLVWQRR
jgi:SAM-dependent methyltransferase